MTEQEKAKESKVQNQVQSGNAPAKVKKNKKTPGVKITPEYIEEQRRLAKIRKAEKQAKQANEPQQVPADLQFIKRPILYLDGNNKDSNVDNNSGQQLSVMTYNLLAQSLIRRSLFPTNGTALKWSKRSVVLLSELQYYSPDILCLQEVDYIQFNNFWTAKFEKMGYYTEYYRFGNKNHGVAIIYRKLIFKKCEVIEHVVYDDVDTAPVAPRTATTNVGLIMQLEFLDSSKTSKKGLVLGTHHLFWHPHGTFERTRQTYVTLKAVQQFVQKRGLDSKQWYKFFCGDFNAEPYHSPYLSITRKPVYYDDVAKLVIEESVKQVFADGAGDEGGAGDDASTPADASKDGPADGQDQNQDTSEQEQPDELEAPAPAPVPVPAPTPARRAYTAAAEGAPKGVATTLSSNDEHHRHLIDDLVNLHNQIPWRAISLYSVGYKQVHPENSKSRNEPDFSNWAHTWRGLLDYIFVITEWDGLNKQAVDTPEELRANEGVILKGLLRVPPREEMSAEGQPRAGEYPSDHLAMMAVIQLT